MPAVAAGYLMESIERELTVEPMSVRRLCARLKLKRSAVAGALGRLVALGRVTRVQPPRPRTGKRGGSVGHEYSLVAWTGLKAKQASGTFLAFQVGWRFAYREFDFVCIRANRDELVGVRLRPDGYPTSIKLTSRGQVGAMRPGERGWRDTGRRLDINDIRRVPDIRHGESA